MTINMSREEVLLEILHLSRSGADLRIQSVKEYYPSLMRNASRYFSNWDKAVKNSELF